MFLYQIRNKITESKAGRVATGLVQDFKRAIPQPSSRYTMQSGGMMGSSLMQRPTIQKKKKKSRYVYVRVRK